MKMGVAQVRAIRGDIKANLNVHLRWMEKAATSGTELLIFPELSLTGYEPTLASALAIDLHDARLDPIQAFCDQHGMSVGAGAPIRTGPGIGIGMIMFHPHQPRWVYTKKYLHADEEPFFVPGHNERETFYEYPRMAPAICYELSVPAHRQRAVQLGADVYLVSVAKTRPGMATATEMLTSFAREYRIWVLVANAVGEAHEMTCGGCSCAIDQSGRVHARFNELEEDILALTVPPNR